MFGFGHPSRARTAIAVAAGLLAFASPTLAQNQLGDFRQWLGGAFGGVGTDPSDPAGFTILVDDDGDPLTPPVAYNLDAQAPELSGATNYALSPTRRTLYVLDEDFGTKVRFESFFSVFWK